MIKFIKRISKKSITKYDKLFNELYNWTSIAKNSLFMLMCMFLLDYFNIFTKLININGLIPLYIIIIVFIVIKLFEFKPWNLCKLKTVNYIDSFLLSIIFSLCMYSIVLHENIFDWKMLLSESLQIILLLIEICRVIIINSIKNIKKETNIYDLKDLYDGNINNTSKLVLIKEKEVNYDLLERGHIINDLYQLISNCHTDEKFVIALEGTWGSGKTTIINNIKSKINDKNIIIIDNFDPWSYEDEKSLFRGMFDAIMSKIGINFSIKDINNFLKVYMDTIFSMTKYEKGYNTLTKYYSESDEKIKTRKIINNYLINNNKKILFIIDNIERAEKKNILFLFKLINNILNFNNTIYLLSFDNERMKRIFESDLNIDYEYLKKIIQLEVKIPKVHPSVINNVTNTCITNLLNIYGINKIDKDYTQVIMVMSKYIKDLRELKRYLNSVISFNYNTKNYLNILDIVLLEIIKQGNINLYETIWKNKKFFVSEDTHIFNELYILDTKAFNEEGKKFFHDLFNNENNEQYKEILKLLFPYVEKYLDGQSLKSEYNGYIVNNNKNEYRNNIRSKKIYMGRYFDLYFTQCENEFININKHVEKFIKVLNENYDIDIVSKEFLTLINLYTNWVQKYTLEVLQQFIIDVNSEKRYLLLMAIYKHLHIFNDASLFLSLNSLSRTHIIISELFLILSDEEMGCFLNEIKNDYSNIYNIYEIIYWMENSKDIEQEKLNIILNKTKEACKLIVIRVIENKIDIFEDSIYTEKNIFGICRGTKDNDELRKKYIKGILNVNNIFRFLNDIITRSVGNSYGYKIRGENIDLFSCRDDINDILKQINRELSDDENLILNIYYKSEKDDFEDAIYLNEDKKFNV